MFNNLVLRIINSPYGDMTRGAVLSHQDVDNNFIYLKGNLVQSGSTSNNNLLLTKINGEVITIPLDFTGSTTGGTGGSGVGITALTFDTNNTITIRDATGGTFTALVNNLSGLTITGSVMNGTGITATGLFSHAEGIFSRATGNYSHAEGSGTTASGLYSHSEGFSSLASGSQSHAEGQATSATTTAAHAEGQATRATGQAAHAEGNATLASGFNSHAEGGSTTASGFNSHAEGSNTTASGFSSHAEGFITIAGGPYTHTEGSATTATGQFSHAEGALTLASGSVSHAEGLGTVAAGDYQSVLGRYNTLGNTTSIFIIGNGTSTSNRSDLVLFNSTGVTFNQAISAVTYYGNGSNLTGITGISALTFDTNNTIILTTTSGSTFRALVNYLSGLTITGSVMNGTGMTASGAFSHAEGSGTTASGIGSHAEGANSSAVGTASHAQGLGTSAIGDFSNSSGLGTIAAGTYQSVFGHYNTTGNTAPLLIIGNGTGDSTRSDLALFYSSGITFNQTISARVHLPAGSTASGTAPLKITSGATLTTPENGAIEYDGTHLYATIGSTRYQLDQQDYELIIDEKTTNYNILSNENSRYFTNEGAVSAITFTLPSAVQALNYTFILENNNAISISANSANTITIGSNTTSSGGTISSVDSGSSITLVAINSLKWIATSVVGTWSV
jgi:hypothetical protein